MNILLTGIKELFNLDECYIDYDTVDNMLLYEMKIDEIDKKVVRYSKRFLIIVGAFVLFFIVFKVLIIY